MRFVTEVKWTVDIKISPIVSWIATSDLRDGFNVQLTSAVTMSQVVPGVTVIIMLHQLITTIFTDHTSHIPSTNWQELQQVWLWILLLWKPYLEVESLQLVRGKSQWAVRSETYLTWGVKSPAWVDQSALRITPISGVNLLGHYTQSQSEGHLGIEISPQYLKHM